MVSTRGSVEWVVLPALSLSLSKQQLATPAWGPADEGMRGEGQGSGGPGLRPNMSLFVWLKVRLSDHSHNGEASNPD